MDRPLFIRGSTNTALEIASPVLRPGSVPFPERAAIPPTRTVEPQIGALMHRHPARAAPDTPGAARPSGPVPPRPPPHAVRPPGGNPHGAGACEAGKSPASSWTTVQQGRFPRSSRNGW
ncbi:hypothetical protein GCM10014719_36410 [Planomonospora parontospora subsp. antibiotica]|nr:hypothetical protein GCM10014719_36410 [Planomonospora parontospora subsp. antibiotica]GII16860.1 hypothetical protein Ppa05_35860 [Planomonospora parontospora subsp. antibiotica]